MSKLNKHQFNTSNPLHGWITPAGEYHHMSPNMGHYEHLKHYGLAGTNPVDNQRLFKEALNRGYIALGHGGTNSLSINTKAHSQSSPALNTLKTLLSDPDAYKFWSKQPIYVNNHSSSDAYNQSRVDVDHFIKHKTFRPVDPLAASEKDCLKKSLPEGTVYVAMDGDSAGSQVERAALKDDIEAIRDISDRIRSASEAVAEAATKLGAEIIVQGGDDLGFTLPKDKIEEIEDLRSLYLKTSKFTITAGVGDSIPKAVHALLYGKMHGKDRTVHWKQEMTEFVESMSDVDEKQKIIESGILESKIEKYEVHTNRAELKKSESAEVVSVAVINKDSVLIGRRNDNERWTLPGGHLNPNEPPKTGALRELFEETGIKANDLKYLGSSWTISFKGKKILVHSFAYVYNQEPVYSFNDPDAEVSQWVFVDCKHGLPRTIEDELHSPRNITLMKLGVMKDLSKAEVDRVLDFESLTKAKVTKKGIIITPSDAVPTISSSSDHKSVIDGINLTTAQSFGDMDSDEDADDLGSTYQYGFSGVGFNKNKKKVIIKEALKPTILNEHYSLEPSEMRDFSSAHREGVFYNMDRDFWKTKSVPKTSVFKDHQNRLYSAQEFMDQSSFVDMDQHEDAIDKMRTAGHLQKLAIMDMISGSADRHPNNYLMTKDKKLALIDNGMAYCHYHDRSRVRSLPDYSYPDHEIPSSVTDWVDKLNTQKFHTLLTKNKVPSRNLMVKMLKRVKENIHNYENINDLRTDLNEILNKEVGDFVVNNVHKNKYYVDYDNLNTDQLKAIAQNKNPHQNHLALLTRNIFNDEVYENAGHLIGKDTDFDNYIASNTKNPKHIKQLLKKDENIPFLACNSHIWKAGKGPEIVNKLLNYRPEHKDIRAIRQREIALETLMTREDIKKYVKPYYPQIIPHLAHKLDRLFLGSFTVEAQKAIKAFAKKKAL